MRAVTGPHAQNSAVRDVVGAPARRAADPPAGRRPHQARAAGRRWPGAARRGTGAAAMTDSDVQERITSYWSDHGPDYDAHPTSRLHMGEAAQRWQQVWASALPQAPADVLDVGTGTRPGRGPPVAAGAPRHRGRSRRGDAGPRPRQGAELDDPPVFRVGDAVRPPLPAASFDAVTARYLLWTLREPVRALRNWRELLRPGGRLAVVDGLWFANGIDTSRDTPDEAVFRSAYQPACGAGADARGVRASAGLRRSGPRRGLRRRADP